jgi:SEC-C motif/Antitoxin Xre/MbcA/ParS C-terminal toxin-binding domain
MAAAAPGRNDPCPCGSGKKYKKCCLQQGREADARLSAHQGAVERALGWLFERHRGAVGGALEDGYFGSLSAEEKERLEGLSDRLREIARINALEWLLAEGTLTVGGREVPAMDLVLGRGGPLLGVEQRGYLETLASRPLRLYEIVESRPGEGMLLRDARERERDPVWVVERAGSRTLVAGGVVAARLIPGDPCELSGAIYSCSALELHVHEALDELEETGEDDPRTAGKAIADLWLQWLTAPPPALLDALGDPVTLVTDHYQVLDRRALERALAACPDVHGDPGQGWSRLEEPHADLSRTLLAINPGAAPDRLELFARTLPLADEGREWFAQLAGAAVRFVAREIVDPLAAIGRRPAREGDLLPESEVPIEVRRRLHHHVYRAWADDPIPALGDQTPRQAMRTEAGRRKVERLLRHYEADELRQAQRSGAEPMRFDFLWEAVGLERPGDGESPAGSNDEE